MRIDLREVVDSGDTSTALWGSSTSFDILLLVAAPLEYDTCLCCYLYDADFEDHHEASSCVVGGDCSCHCF